MGHLQKPNEVFCADWHGSGHVWQIYSAAPCRRRLRSRSSAARWEAFALRRTVISRFAPARVCPQEARWRMHR